MYFYINKQKNNDNNKIIKKFKNDGSHSRPLGKREWKL